MADAQDLQDVKTVLLRTDDEFRQLVTDHQALDGRIQHLATLAGLTEQQHFEETALKKRKLALKDRIEALVRLRRPAEAETVSH